MQSLGWGHGAECEGSALNKGQRQEHASMHWNQGIAQRPRCTKESSAWAQIFRRGSEWRSRTRWDGRIEDGRCRWRRTTCMRHIGGCHARRRA
eukprot:3067077-Pleurochrysis_carterae.AAC.1